MDELKKIIAALPALVAEVETLEDLASIKAASDAQFSARYKELVIEQRKVAARAAALAELEAAQKRLEELGGA